MATRVQFNAWPTFTFEQSKSLYKYFQSFGEVVEYKAHRKTSQALSGRGRITFASAEAAKKCLGQKHDVAQFIPGAVHEKFYKVSVSPLDENPRVASINECFRRHGADPQEARKRFELVCEKVRKSLGNNTSAVLNKALDDHEACLHQAVKLRIEQNRESGDNRRYRPRPPVGPIQVPKTVQREGGAMPSAATLETSHSIAVVREVETSQDKSQVSDTQLVEEPRTGPHSNTNTVTN